MWTSLLSVVFLVATTSNALSCLDMDESPVDWWFIYKTHGTFNFAYRDSNDVSQKSLQISSKMLNVTKEYALGSTLHQLYMDKTGLTWMAYNDEAPVTYSNLLRKRGGAHAKGILVGGATDGFWLVHSVPKFPDLTAVNFAYDTSVTYGQTFLCLSMKKTAIERAAVQLQYFHPDIYDSNINSKLKYAELDGVISGSRLEASNIEELTVGAFTAVSFAKSNKWGQDLYEDLVSPYYKKGFMWETWRRPPQLDTFCSPEHTYDAINVQSISFPDSPEWSWSYTADHAKWGMSLNSSLPVVCVGDINRMSSQRSRGGGTVCLQDKLFYNAMHAIIDQTDSC